jgi:hypothetical protein
MRGGERGGGRQKRREEGRRGERRAEEGREGEKRGEGVIGPVHPTINSATGCKI